MAKFCTQCGAFLDDDKLFCTECGKPLDSADAPAPAQAPAPRVITAPTAPSRRESQTRSPRTGTGIGTDRPARSAPRHSAYAAEPPPPQRRDYGGETPAAPRGAYGADAPPPRGSRYEPISVGGYIGISLLMCIPIVGLILMLVWAFGGCRKVNKRNLARASLIMMVIALVISLILGLVFRSLFKKTVESIEDETGVSITDVLDGSVDSGDLGGLVGAIGGLAGSTAPTNSDIQELEELGEMLEGLEDATGGASGDWSGLIDGAIEANREAEALNDGWPASLRPYPGGSATAVASYRTEITGTTHEEMMGWINALKGDGFVYQDFFDFGMSEADMLSMNGWWGYDGKTYLSVSFYDGTVTIDHTKELPDLASYFG